MLRFRNLGSGSTGNATVIEAGARPGRQVRVLVDCGLGIRILQERLLLAGIALQQLDAIFITHEHSDHMGCVHKLALRHRIPVWMSHGTWTATGSPDFDGLLRTAHDASRLDLGDLELLPFTVPHDAREPLQLTCSDGASRLGILTDLGHASSHVVEHLQGCDALMLECNHDPQMLANSSYPPYLKRRVGGSLGHLSNEDAGALLRQLDHPRLRCVVAAHLSQQNNQPTLARAALAQACDGRVDHIRIADANAGTDWITV